MLNTILKEDQLYTKLFPILESSKCGNEPLVSIKAHNLQTVWTTSSLYHRGTYSGCLFKSCGSRRHFSCFLFWWTLSWCWQGPLLSLYLTLLLHHNGGKLSKLWCSTSIPIHLWQVSDGLLVRINMHAQYIKIYGTERNKLNALSTCKRYNSLITQELRILFGPTTDDVAQERCNSWAPENVIVIPQFVKQLNKFQLLDDLCCSKSCG